jgi:hypothetical protein
MQGVSKQALQWYSKCYCVANVTITFQRRANDPSFNIFLLCVSCCGAVFTFSYLLAVFFIGVFSSFLLSVEVIPFIFSLVFYLLCSFTLFLHCLTLYCGLRLLFEAVVTPFVNALPYYHHIVCFSLPRLCDYVVCYMVMNITTHK